MQERIFPGTLDSLAPLREYVAEAARTAGLNSGSTYNLCLAVDEIATNIVLHGYQKAGLTGEITVDALQEHGSLIIRMVDHGRTYDPNHVPHPDSNNPLSEPQTGGWGVFLSKTGVDQFDYTSTDCGNVHRFVVRLPKKDSCNVSR
jgi:anti-sigma regulatory factor (Ser/Thr protein kinase)